MTNKSLSSGVKSPVPQVQISVAPRQVPLNNGDESARRLEDADANKKEDIIKMREMLLSDSSVEAS